MKKICLSDADIDLFEDELVPHEFDFFLKHRETFKCMWIEQGKPFWTRFMISFRSYTSKHGIIKDMPYESDRLLDIVDFAFIVVHENFVDGKASNARNFLMDIARLAQNKDKLPYLDSKKFSKDPFYCRETRDVFRTFFGPPTEKMSYVKVYILFPVYLRLCGSICRCLIRWMDASKQETDDESYWTPPEPIQHPPKSSSADDTEYLNRVLMCQSCIETCGVLFLKEMHYGCPDGPQHLDLWTNGNPRFNDPENPLYDPQYKESDWRASLNIDDFRDFIYYLKIIYGGLKGQCKECTEIRENKEKMVARNDAMDAKRNRKRNRKSKKNKTKKDSEVEVTEDLQVLADILKLTVYGFDAANPDVDPTSLLATDPPLKRIRLIGRNAVVNRSVKYGLSEVPSGGKTSAGIQVVVIYDPDTKCKETVLYVPNTTDTKPKNKEYYRINLDTFQNLPAMFEFMEGVGWCAAVFNYFIEEGEQNKDFTHFSVKVSGQNEHTVISIMECLLKYVGSRKSRPCPGWILDADDVVTCSIMNETSLMGVTVIITTGCYFKDLLTQWEFDNRRPKYSISEIKRNEEEDEFQKFIISVNEEHKKGIHDDLKLTEEILDGWEHYMEIVKAIYALCKELKLQESEKPSTKLFMNIGVVDGEIQFYLLENKKNITPETCYHPTLEVIDHLHLKAWMQLEKQGTRAKGSGRILYRFSLKQWDDAQAAATQNEGHGRIEVQIDCQRVRKISKIVSQCHYSSSESHSLQDLQAAKTKIAMAQKFANKVLKDMNSRQSIQDVLTFQKMLKECSKKVDRDIKVFLPKKLTEKQVSKTDEITIKENRKQLKREDQKVKVEQKGANKAKVEEKKQITGTNKKTLGKEKDDTDDDDSDDDDTEDDDAEDTTDDSDEDLQHQLRVCSHCSKTEPVFRTFKKCQRCQQEGSNYCRFYCSRDCQVEDWLSKHRIEHQENKLD